MNRDWILWLGLAALAIAATGGLVMGPRGIRNNNPGNIRHGPSKWQGMSASQTDSEYIQFDDPVYGIRALAKLLKNYQSRYGLNTVDKIISRWAPPNENDTESYIRSVSSTTGLKRHQQIDVNDHLPGFVLAIIKHENGEQPYTVTQIEKGISLA